MTGRQKTMTYSISAVLIVITALVIILNYKRMKQSIKGAIGKSFFSIRELCASDTARRYNIDNTPTPEVTTRLQALIDNVLDPARKEYGSYIYVNSGYRSPRLNAAVGGATHSQHLKGEAADITTKSAEKDKQLFAIIVRQNNFDQLIWEKPKNSRWIHVSYKANGGNRHQILAYNGSSYTNITNNWQTYTT